MPTPLWVEGNKRGTGVAVIPFHSSAPPTVGAKPKTGGFSAF